MLTFSTCSLALSLSHSSCGARRPADEQISLAAKLKSWPSSALVCDALKAGMTAWINSEGCDESFSDTSSEGGSGDTDSDSDAESIASSIFDSPPPSPRRLDTHPLPSLPENVTNSSISTLTLNTDIDTKIPSTSEPVSSVAKLSTRTFSFRWCDEFVTPDSYFRIPPVFDHEIIVTPLSRLQTSLSSNSEKVLVIPTCPEVSTSAAAVSETTSTLTIANPISKKQSQFRFDWSSEDFTPDSYFLLLPSFDEAVATPLPTPTLSKVSVEILIEEDQTTFGTWTRMSSNKGEEDDDDYFATLPTWDEVPSTSSADCVEEGDDEYYATLPTWDDPAPISSPPATPHPAKATLPVITRLCFPTPIHFNTSSVILSTISEDEDEEDLPEKVEYEYASTFVDLSHLRKPLKTRVINSGITEHPQELLRSAIGRSAWMKGLATAM